MVASGERLSSWARFASGTITYTNPCSGSGPRARKYRAPVGISGRSSSACCSAMYWSVQRSTCPAYRCGSVRSSAAVIPIKTPGGAISRSELFTHPSSSTRVQSPERPSTRSGADGANVPAGAPSGARYSTVRRAVSRRAGSSGPGEPAPVSGGPTPGPWPGVPGAPGAPGRGPGVGLPESASELATCARLSTAAFSTQPARSTWTQFPDVPSATLLSRNPCGSLAIRAPAGAERRFSSGARLTARSYPARGVAPTEVAKIHPSSVTPCQSSCDSPPTTIAPRARRARRFPPGSWKNQAPSVVTRWRAWAASEGQGASQRTTGRARRARLDCIPSNMAKRHGPRTPVVLIVLDGWGFRPGREGNAVELGDTPTWHRLWAKAPRTLLNASGLPVGLPDGQIGNSEVGHLNLGAGRVVPQDIVRISQAIESGEFFRLPPLTELCARVKQRGGTLHLLGLIGSGGVHALDQHLVAAVRLGHLHDLPVAIHAWLDGRDTPPQSGLAFMQELVDQLAQYGGPAAVSTVVGRYYAMDRDKRGERTKIAYDAMVHGVGEGTPDPLSDVRRAYEPPDHGELRMARLIAGTPRIRPGDGVFCFNYRADRMRQIVRALAVDGFDGLDRKSVV